MSPTLAFWIGVLGALGTAVASRRFYRQQNQGKIGGSISLPKAYWLGLVVYCWYILGTLFVCLEPALAFHNALLAASISVWLRGPIELAMLFHYKNWLPKYGITHNAATLVLILLGAIWGRSAHQPVSLLDWAALTMWILNMSMELYHAIAFSKIVGDSTQGDQAIWFANAHAPEFQRINRITKRNNLILTLTAILALGLMANGSSPSSAPPVQKTTQGGAQ